MVHGPATPASIPAGARLGAITIALGLVLDVAEHGFAVSGPRPVGEGSSLGEHAAHLVVLAGMVLILAAIVRDGVRNHGRGRPHLNRSVRDAIR